MTIPRSLRAALTAIALVLTIVIPAGTAAAAEDDVTFTGHGWGHGRGMGQYGALGYALDHAWGYKRILDHFYGGTTMGTAANTPIDVELVGKTNTFTIVAGSGLRINGADVAGSGLDVLLVEKTAGGYSVKKGTGCETPYSAWTLVGTYASGVEFTVPSQASYDALVRVCESGNVMRAYRGSIVVRNHAVSTQQMTFNRTSVENYLRGVVPRESPASWGDLPNGMEALKAQAVAARSYALASSRPSGATTCDTDACQVYRGAAIYRWTGSTYARSTVATDVLEQANSNAAIDQTAGQIRVSSGRTARTEFSSSTGGWTAGGTFPAVRDDGDATSRNPNHNWSTLPSGAPATLKLADVAARLGTGTIRSIAVTGRNGLGADGGRVTQVTVVNTSGVSKVFTGNQVRSKLGLKSDWFSISYVSRAEAEAVVKALYEDILLRPVDPTGLSTWTTKLLQGTSQSELVGTLTRSDEYIRLRITQAYQEVLGRAPEPSGLTYWRQEILAGRATVDDVKRRFYDSQEYYNRSGGTPEGYIDLLYKTMLNRTGSASEIAYWSGRIAVVGRSRVVDSIWFSMEAAMYRSGNYYQVFLKRAPDRAGQEYWAKILLSQGEGAVRQGIAGSLEYRLLAVKRFP